MLPIPVVLLRWHVEKRMKEFVWNCWLSGFVWKSV